MGEMLVGPSLDRCHQKTCLGEKITIEGQSRWVNSKYERLPNFCYKCGLLSHALKDYSEGLENNNQVKVECMQYGAWLRGEL